LLPAGTLAGLCPACLLQQGAAADTATGPKTKPFVPPTVEEVARLFPQLEILGFLGKGGMGAVYKARQPALDRFVALKILPAQSVAPDPGFAERFTREARALARLSHPNIVAVFEYGQVSASGAGVSPALGSPSPGIEGNAGGTPAPAAETPAPLLPAPLPYFIMEFVDGVNLRQLQKAGRLSPREALQIVPQICDALQYAHDEGVVHRDIKPENVLVDRKGRVKIADFGLAKIMGRNPESLRLTGEGQVMGTPHYMAPEQVEHPLTVDHRADIFSLGVVFYEMLTGELPLGKFQPPSRKVQMDVRLDDVVLRALEKEPERRYQHAGEVKSAVETIASGTTHSGLTARNQPTVPAEARGETTGESRLSRTALAGAIWAAFVFLACLGLVGARYAAPAAQHTGLPWRQMVLIVLMISLVPLGITAPFGTTLLGWIAVAQIRRSAGRLYGLGLAFLDGMLFPLIALAGLLAWFWWWFYSDAVPRAIMFDSGPPGTVHVISSFHAFILHNIGALTVLVAVATSGVGGFFLISWAWRKVSTPLDGGPEHSTAPEPPPAAPPSPGGVGAWKVAAAVIVAVVALNCVIAVLALRPALSKSPLPFRRVAAAGDTNMELEKRIENIARLKFEIAERELNEIAKKQQVGVATPSDFEKAKMARDIAAAELKGDLVEVARLKLQITELDLRDIQKKVQVGRAAPLDYDKARLARDVAAAEYFRQQQLHSKQN
jgi:serine/threonine protein kinase